MWLALFYELEFWTEWRGASEISNSIHYFLLPDCGYKEPPCFPQQNALSPWTVNPKHPSFLKLCYDNVGSNKCTVLVYFSFCKFNMWSTFTPILIKLRLKSFLHLYWDLQTKYWLVYILPIRMLFGGAKGCFLLWNFNVQNAGEVYFLMATNGPYVHISTRAITALFLCQNRIILLYVNWYFLLGHRWFSLVAFCFHSSQVIMLSKLPSIGRGYQVMCKWRSYQVVCKFQDL